MASRRTATRTAITRCAHFSDQGTLFILPMTGIGCRRCRTYRLFLRSVTFYGYALQAESSPSAGSQDAEGDDTDDLDFRPAKRRNNAAPPAPKRADGAPAAGRRPSAALPAQARPAGQSVSEADAATAYVPCPVCSTSVRATFMNAHLDKCLAGGGEAAPKPKPAAAPLPGSRAGPSAALGASSSGRRLEPPPKLCFTLMSDKQVKAALQKHGLAADGRRDELIERYGRYRRAVQAAQDEGRDVSQAKLLAEFTAEERRLAAAIARGSAPAGGGKGGNGATAAPLLQQRRPVSAGVAGEAVADSNFNALIQSVRQRQALHRQRDSLASGASTPGPEDAAPGTSGRPGVGDGREQSSDVDLVDDQDVDAMLEEEEAQEAATPPDGALCSKEFGGGQEADDSQGLSEELSEAF